MPQLLRQSGAKWTKDGQTVTPRALITICEGCGFEGAPFGTTVDAKRLWWCGWVNNEPTCINRGETK